MLANRQSLAIRPGRQGTAAPLPNHYWIEEVCCARGRIRNISGKNRIGNPGCTLVTRIVRRKLLHLFASRHPGLKLPRLRYHVLDVVTPSAALLPVQNDIGNCSLALVSLMRSLKGDRPN